MATNNHSDDLPQKAQKLVEGLLRLGIDGVGPLKSARESAEEARKKTNTDDQAIKSLIRTHVALAAGQGFLLNLGGLITLPVALPANVGAAFLIQTHLVAAIAHLKGHDLDDENVRSAIVLCLLGNAAVEVLKKAGIRIGQRFTLVMIRKLPIEVIRSINRRVGFMLIAKYGSKRAIVTLTKFIPVFGGIVGGGFDAAATRGVGAFSKRFFTDTPPEPLAATVA
jgi:hypothetical protein